MKIYPSVEEIKEKYQSFKTVPVSTEIEADVSALTVLKKLKNVSSHCYMLESNDDANNTGRYTFLGYAQLPLQIRSFHSGIRLLSGQPENALPIFIPA